MHCWHSAEERTRPFREELFKPRKGPAVRFPVVFQRNRYGCSGRRPASRKTNGAFQLMAISLDA
jgi:hypothetical protein